MRDEPDFESLEVDLARNSAGSSRRRPAPRPATPHPPNRKAAIGCALFALLMLFAAQHFGEPENFDLRAATIPQLIEIASSPRASIEVRQAALDALYTATKNGGEAIQAIEREGEALAAQAAVARKRLLEHLSD